MLRDQPRTVVLGVGGWLGSAILKHLNHDGTTRGLGRHELAGASSAALRALLDPSEVLTVVNAVGLLRGSVDDLRAANLEFTQRLVEALRGSGAHLVHLGSAAEYGDQGEEPIRETALRRPVTPYGGWKAQASDLVLAEPSWCVLRPFNVIDRAMVPMNPVAVIVEGVRAALNDTGVLTLPAPQAVRDHVSRGFTAASVATAARSRLGGCYNLASGIGLRYEEIAESIAERMGGRVSIEDLGHPGIPTVIGDASVWCRATGLSEALDAGGVAELVTPSG